ncbi:MAG: hypothetical protein ABIM21_01860 [candidate division WOR-3 bacterium]
MQIFTFQELERELLEEIKNDALKPLLRNKIKYMLRKSLKEGLLVKKGKKYYLKEINSFLSQDLEKFFARVYSILKEIIRKGS